jgi:hypothetical protein
LSTGLAPVFIITIRNPLIRCQRLGLHICSTASSEMKSMNILLRFSVFFAGMVGLHNAEEIHESCKTGTHVQSGEEMGLFIPLGPFTIFVLSCLSTKMARFNCPNLEYLFKCLENKFPDFNEEATVS